MELKHVHPYSPYIAIRAIATLCAVTREVLSVEWRPYIYVSFNMKPSLTAGRRTAISRYTKSASTFCFLGLAHHMLQQVLKLVFFPPRVLTNAWRLVNVLLKTFWICTKCTPHALKLDRLRYAFIGIRRTRFERMALCYKLRWNGYSLYWHRRESVTMARYW